MFKEENTFEKEEAAVETIKEAVRSIRNIQPNHAWTGD